MLSGPEASLLLVDDDSLLRQMAAETLRHAGFEVTAVGSGEEALAAFAREKFDLMLLDVMMPGLGGFEVCRRIRQQSAGTSLPILMLTGLDDTDSIETAFRYGATDFVTKPINWTLLNHRVRYNLRASAASENVARGKDRLARAQQLANMGSWEWYPSTMEFICSSELERIFAGGSAPHSALDAQRFFDHVVAVDREQLERLRRAAVNEGVQYKVQYGIERSDGCHKTVFEQAVVVTDRDGQVVKVEGITQDVSESVEAQQRIRELAYFDSITGLPNRQLFTDMAAPALERTHRLGNQCAVLYIDLDHFKNVNDAFGRGRGDQLLLAIAERLQASTRSYDLSAAADRIHTAEILARIGGNSFTVLLVDIADSNDSARVAKRLLDVIAQPLLLEGKETVVTASVGIAIYPRDAQDIPGLCEKAEQALYAAKDAGRATYRFFDREMNDAAISKQTLAGELRHAIASDELRLFYQPKIDAESGAMVGAEALVRWQHPQRGLIGPSAFIPLAEELGLIVPLGDWVLRTAIAALGTWLKSGLTNARLSINLSSASFIQDDLVSCLDEYTHNHDVDPDLLTLEITESVLVKDAERTVTRMHALRELGFGLSLDDFGTGYSSLSYLKVFPIDELKIDQSFVRDLTRDDADAALVRSIIALGEEFRLRIVAEGVETQAQASYLLGLGCSLHQGYLYARPMPHHEFEMRLRGGGRTPARPTLPAASTEVLVGTVQGAR